MLGVTLRWTSVQSRGNRNTPTVNSCYSGHLRDRDLVCFSQTSATFVGDLVLSVIAGCRYSEVFARRELTVAASCYRNRDKLWPDEPLGSYADLSTSPGRLQQTSYSCFHNFKEVLSFRLPFDKIFQSYFYLRNSRRAQQRWWRRTAEKRIWQRNRLLHWGNWSRVQRRPPKCSVIYKQGNCAFLSG